MAFLQGKTPISFLQELCTKRGSTPQYDLIANEGAVHEPTFVFKVTAGEFMGTGKGPSKKKAKHNAALSVLQQMMGTGEAAPAVVDQLNAQMTEGDEGDNLGNPVGELQEMTQKRLWPPPTYEFTSEQGPPHAREFICTVRLISLHETRPGKSKKIAKRNAAAAMMQLLRQGVPTDQPIGDELEVGAEEEEEEAMPLPNSEMRNAFSALRDGRNINPLNSKAQVKVSQFFQQLRVAPGNGLLKLHGTLLNRGKDEDYCSLLAEIGREKKFEVTYVDLPEPTFTGLHQCFVEMQFKKEKKKLVCAGQGTSLDSAYQNGAAQAVQLLDKMSYLQNET